MSLRGRREEGGTLALKDEERYSPSLASGCGNLQSPPLCLLFTSKVDCWPPSTAEEDLPHTPIKAM